MASTDSNLHKRLNALGCPKKGRPDVEGTVEWSHQGDLLGDGFCIRLTWTADRVSMDERFQPAGSDENAPSIPLWSFEWERRTDPDNRVQWRLSHTQGERMQSVTTLEETVSIAREAVRRIGVAAQWPKPLTPATLPSSSAPSRKGFAC